MAKKKKDKVKSKDKERRYFLVDYENVHMAGLHGVEELSKSDKVIIFYSQNADSLNFEVMKLISSTKAHVEYIKVDTQGKNALDFQLSSYIGYLLGQDAGCECYIVSNDKGYVNVQIFWFKLGQKVKLVPNIRERRIATVKQQDIIDVIMNVDILNDNEKTQASDLVWKHMKTGSPHLSHIKVGINNDLVHALGGEKTKAVFNAIRPLMK
ncbi:MAG: PIN domain-containing protein [Oscillospiraceae bacterium]